MRANSEELSKKALLGTVVSGIVYPAIMLKNGVQTGLFKNSALNLWDPAIYFKGITPFMCSYVPTAMVAMTVNGALARPDASFKEKLAVGFCSGFASGIFCVAQETVAQNMSTPDGRGKTARVVVREAVALGGYRSLARGTVAISCREGGFASGYLVAMPLVREKVPSDMGSAAIVGTVVGTVTTPFDFFRAKKQASVTVTKTADSYATIFAKNRPRVAGMQGLFKGVAGRSVACAGAIYLMDKGRRALNM